MDIITDAEEVSAFARDVKMGLYSFSISWFDTVAWFGSNCDFRFLNKLSFWCSYVEYTRPENSEKKEFLKDFEKWNEVNQNFKLKRNFFACLLLFNDEKNDKGIIKMLLELF